MSFADNLHTQLQNSAHAYLITGDRQTNRGELVQVLEKHIGHSLIADSDTHVIDVQSLSIADVRQITHIQQQGLSQKKHPRYIIVSFDAITVEAQNAFLKTLEDPAGDTVYFLLCGSHDSLLPTVLSRVITLDGIDANVYEQQAHDFMRTAVVEREKIYQQFMAEKKTDKSADKAGAQKFFSALEYQLLQERASIEDFSFVYQQFLQTTKFTQDRSSNIKYIFEYISVLLPVIK